jgi:hypothetical protein
MVIGRPRLFKSVEEFKELSDAYFRENEGGRISWTGLCLAVGADSRQALDRYKKGEHGAEFVGPIKIALMIVENYYEETTDGAKSIFILKNFDWKDKQEIDMTTREADLTEEQLEAQIKAMERKLADNKS